MLLTVFFAVLAGVAAVISVAVQARSVRLQADMRAICESIRNERARIATHDVELDKITSEIRKLAGRLYATAPREPKPETPETVATDRIAWKAAMREKLSRS